MPERRTYATLGPEQKAKAIARGKLNLAVYHGRVKRQPCEVCGITEGVEAHHPDYSKPLEVEWLCPTHHREREAMSRIKPNEVSQAQRFADKVVDLDSARALQAENERRYGMPERMPCGCPVDSGCSGRHTGTG